MPSHTKQRLITRLQWYYPIEHFNAWFFLGLAIYLNITEGVASTLFLTYGLGVMVFILFQGSHYWKRKLHVLLGRPFNQAKELANFKRFKSINVGLFWGSPLILIVQWFLLNGKLDMWTLAFALLANGFAMLEHINYYHTQLMVDNVYDLAYIRRNRRLKKASLRKDLEEGRF